VVTDERLDRLIEFAKGNLIVGTSKEIIEIMQELKKLREVKNNG